MHHDTYAANLGGISGLAIALNEAMRDNAAAQAAYLATYGVAWEPLVACGYEPGGEYAGEAFDATTFAVGTDSESSREATCAAAPRARRA